MKGPPAPTPTTPSVNAALRRARGYPGGITFVDLQEGETQLTWRQIHDRASHVAAALADRGIGRGDRVGLILATGPAFLDGFFGAMLAGAIPVPLSPPQRLGRLDEYHAATARMLQVSGARIGLTDARIQRLLGVAMATARPELGCHEVESLLAFAGTLDLDNAPESIAVIQFSSGSTVDPKPVALTQANLMAQLAAIDQMVPSNQNERQVGVSWLPLHHDMGLIGCLLSAVYRPDPLVLIPPELFLARPALWLRAIARHRATVSPAPSFAYSLCLKRIKDADLTGLDLSSWRFALNGAEPVSVGVLDAFAARFAPWGFDPCALTPVYGMAEATLAVTFSPPGAPSRSLNVDPVRLATEAVAVEPTEGGRRIASVGFAVPGVECVVRDEGQDELGERRVGRIWVRGPAVMAGYFNDVDATRAVLVDGWLDTGDLGFVADGELYVCGRAKDVVIIRGANHTPQAFEECCDSVPGVRQGCTVALGFIPQGSDGDEQLLILAEYAGKQAEPSLEGEIRSAILLRTGVRAHTVCVLAPGTLPRTTSGKLRRAEALRQYVTGTLTPPRPVSPWRLAGAMARSFFAFARLRVSDAR
ncbi:MAG: fatty acyl-AMP ligase [Candidatus Sericytochromatia bacterium]|nr:fatty acyl-AMP ligase [Candidatus Sericytochromatia bacterium]